MDEEYDVIVLGTGLKVKFIYTNIASHDNKDSMTSILNKFYFWRILMERKKKYSRQVNRSQLIFSVSVIE